MKANKSTVFEHFVGGFHACLVGISGTCLFDTFLLGDNNLML